MNPAQILLLAKIGAVGVLFVGLYGIGHHNGEKAVQGRWDASKVIAEAARTKLIEDHAEEVAKIRADQDATNIKVSKEHDAAIENLINAYDARIASINRAGGLRVPRSICNSTSPATEAPGDGGHNEDPAATVELPNEFANDLFSEAKRADEIVEQARTCQAWILANGFYGAKSQGQ